MIYAVIDTNVLVAAAKTHKPESSTSRVLSLVFAIIGGKEYFCCQVIDNK